MNDMEELTMMVPVLVVNHPGNRKITYSNVRRFYYSGTALMVEGSEAEGERYNVSNDEPIESLEMHYEEWAVTL